MLVNKLDSLSLTLCTLFSDVVSISCLPVPSLPSAQLRSHQAYLHSPIARKRTLPSLESGKGGRGGESTCAAWGWDGWEVARDSPMFAIGGSSRKKSMLPELEVVPPLGGPIPPPAKICLTPTQLPTTRPPMVHTISEYIIVRLW